MIVSQLDMTIYSGKGPKKVKKKKKSFAGNQFMKKAKKLSQYNLPSDLLYVILTTILTVGYPSPKSPAGL